MSVIEPSTPGFVVVSDNRDMSEFSEPTEQEAARLVAMTWTSPTLGLRGFEASKPGEVYVDCETGERWEAIGWINHPAVILRNVRTDERHVEVIGCRNAERFRLQR